METMTRREGEKIGDKVAVEKPHKKVIDKLVIRGNNSTVRIVMPLLVLNKDSTRTSSTRPTTCQNVAIMET